ncbi:MAG: sigma-70 family RNA polymerase sigma factor [Calothrix sp. FI2-JRJ7]|jgi:RNA polymerase sigma-B factor|nr:sigma-70 family RNA polymerase sigma factor [Calothrix sp. FI2-JRJ7]
MDSQPSIKIRKRNKFAEQNAKLVHKIAHKYTKKCNEPYDDIYQVGWIGLLKACDNFKPELNNAFSSFAVPKIEGEIQHYLRDKVPSLKVPRHALEKFAQVKRLRKQFIASGRELKEEQIAKKLGINEEQWKEITALNSAPAKVSWDELPYEPMIDEARTEDNSPVYEALAKLDSRQRYCITQRFFQGKSIQYIANNLKTSTITIEATIAEALYLLNSYLSSNYEH